VNLVAEMACEGLVGAGVDVPLLPLESVVLVTAFAKRPKKIRKQDFLNFTMGDDMFEGIFMVSPQLANHMITCCPFLMEYGISISFERGSYSYARGGELTGRFLNQRSGLQKGRSNDHRREENHARIHNPLIGQGPASPSADRPHLLPCDSTTSTQTVLAGSEEEGSTCNWTRQLHDADVTSDIYVCRDNCSPFIGTE
jgi:hypothetical protein